MISATSLVIFGSLLGTITIAVQSVPLEIIPSPKKASLDSIDSVQPPASSSTSNPAVTSTTVPQINDVKKRHDIDESESTEDDEVNIENKVQTEIKETPAQNHDNIDQSVNTNNIKIFSDIKMNPNELINLARKRRNIHLNDQSNQRHKRALSTYDFYNTNPFYESLIEQEQLLRPSRAFAPIYWYPPSYKRDIRSTFASSFYKPSESNRVYTDTSENDDIDEDQVPFYLNDENDYEYNRYPVLSDESDIPYDNLRLQQEYNIDDLPIDEDEGFFSSLNEPIEDYFE